MKMSRRDALIATAGALMLPALSGASAVASPTAPDSDVRRALEAAAAAFFKSWATGDWDPFLDRCDSSLTFQFPVGDQRGRHRPPTGKQALIAWAENHRLHNNRITESIVDLKLFADDWLIICDRGNGSIAGEPYTGLHALFMRAGPTGKLIEFREYFGEIAG